MAFYFGVHFSFWSMYIVQAMRRSDVQRDFAKMVNYFLKFLGLAKKNKYPEIPYKFLTFILYPVLSTYKLSHLRLYAT